MWVSLMWSRQCRRTVWPASHCLTTAACRRAIFRTIRVDVFFIARSGGEIFGAVAIEALGEAVLFRSPREARNGPRAYIGEEAEKHAAAAGVRRLFLLTTSAASFFERQGYSLGQVPT